MPQQTTSNFVQKHEYDCGPSCVAFYAHMLDGVTLTEEQYAQLMAVMDTTEDGTDTIGLVKGLQSLGFESWESENDPQTLYLWPRLGYAIWCVDNEEHWVVLLECTRVMAVYFDPETGNVHLCPINEFQERIASSGYTYVAAVKERP